MKKRKQNDRIWADILRGQIKEKLPVYIRYKINTGYGNKNQSVYNLLFSLKHNLIINE